MNKLLDILLPRFIVEDVALQDAGDHLEIVCSLADVKPGETYPAVATMRVFNLFGMALFPTMIGAPRPWPAITHPAGVPSGTEAPAHAAEQITLPPCPFCEGPPAVIVTRTFEPLGSVEPTEHFGCTGLDVDAYVFCHECGAEGPKHETVIFTHADYMEAEREGAVLWTERSAKHRHLYDAGSPEGLNLYPREAGQ